MNNSPLNPRLIDKELLEDWRRGDVSSGQALFQRYYDMVERFFMNKVTTHVRDLVQQTFIACVESKERIREGAKFRSYLFAVAHNVLREYLRKKRRSPNFIDWDAVSVQDVAPGPSTLLTRHREQELLLEALRAIPLKYQLLLELHYWEQMSSTEIAETLGLPVGTVKSRMRLARGCMLAKLRELASSPKLMRSTVADLDKWVNECRACMMESSPNPD